MVTRWRSWLFFFLETSWLYSIREGEGRKRKREGEERKEHSTISAFPCLQKFRTSQPPSSCGTLKIIPPSSQLPWATIFGGWSILNSYRDMKHHLNVLHDLGPSKKTFVQTAPGELDGGFWVQDRSCWFKSQTGPYGPCSAASLLSSSSGLTVAVHQRYDEDWDIVSGAQALVGDPPASVPQHATRSHHQVLCCHRISGQQREQ